VVITVMKLLEASMSAWHTCCNPCVATLFQREDAAAEVFNRCSYGLTCAVVCVSAWTRWKGAMI
jgi:hypothetical protein